MKIEKMTQRQNMEKSKDLVTTLSLGREISDVYLKHSLDESSEEEIQQTECEEESFKQYLNQYKTKEEPSTSTGN